MSEPWHMKLAIVVANLRQRARAHRFNYSENPRRWTQLEHAKNAERLANQLEQVLPPAYHDTQTELLD